MSIHRAEREKQRQLFLEEIDRVILDEIEETHQARLAMYALNAVFLQYLSHNEACNIPFIVDSPAKISMHEVFTSIILPQIDTFSTGEEEKLSLIAALFVWTSESIARIFMDELQALEVSAEVRKLTLR